jgi:hypothetical protein
MRLNISTLLTAKFRHKNTAFPLDTISITYFQGKVKEQLCQPFYQQ